MLDESAHGRRHVKLDVYTLAVLPAAEMVELGKIGCNNQLSADNGRLLPALDKAVIKPVEVGMLPVCCADGSWISTVPAEGDDCAALTSGTVAATSGAAVLAAGATSAAA